MPPPQPRPKLIFLVTEDWYFWSHRLPVARAARDAGFDVAVAARVQGHGEQIYAEGFRLHSLPWRRRGDGVVGAVRAISAIAALYRRERPDMVHHVALKPVVLGGVALRLAYPRNSGRPAEIAAITGLGSELSGTSGLSRAVHYALGQALKRAHVIVQNPEDGAALGRNGVPSTHLTLIRGSGIDTSHFTSLPEPADSSLKVALVARMLRSKGVIDAVAAVRLLRARGMPVELMLAGPPDPDNRDSLTEAELTALAAEPGVAWLGRVADIREVWRRAAIAVYPSTYGEGVPKALLEAAACARPIVAADMPGCREVVRDGITGLLVLPRNIAALADAIASLAVHPTRRAAMGQAGRALVEREFGEERVARETMAIYQAVLRERGFFQ